MMIDFATLTGSVVIALGDEMAGLFASSDTLADALLHAAKTSGDQLWRMPLYHEYLESYHSEIADLMNSGGGRDAGSIKGALFLHEFVGKVPWAHLDIAGSAFINKPRHHYPTRGTGYGVRLLIDFFASFAHTARD
jgi:leucyl aminopeptidase